MGQSFSWVITRPAGRAGLGLGVPEISNGSGRVGSEGFQVSRVGVGLS